VCFYPFSVLVSVEQHVLLARLGFLWSLGTPRFTVVKTLYHTFIAPRICLRATSLCSHRYQQKFQK
jgi:hypothetical protein